MSHSFYNILHILGIALVLVSVGGVCIHAANGGSKSDSKTHKLVLAMHGIGILVILIAGFGMLAKLGLSGLPGWVVVKLVLWVLLGLSIALPYRRPQLARGVLVLLPVLATIAAWFAITKPF